MLSPLQFLIELLKKCGKMAIVFNFLLLSLCVECGFGEELIGKKMRAQKQTDLREKKAIDGATKTVTKQEIKLYKKGQFSISIYYCIVISFQYSF